MMFWKIENKKPAACMQVKNHLFLRRGGQNANQSEQDWHSLSPLLALLSPFRALRSFMSDLRMEKHECVFFYTFWFTIWFLRFFKTGSLANKSCTLISWRSRFFISRFFSESLVRRSNKFVENSINLATKKYLSYLSLHKGHLLRRGTGASSKKKNWLRLRGRRISKGLSHSLSLFFSVSSLTLLLKNLNNNNVLFV